MVELNIAPAAVIAVLAAVVTLVFTLLGVRIGRMSQRAFYLGRQQNHEAELEDTEERQRAKSLSKTDAVDLLMRRRFYAYEELLREVRKPINMVTNKWPRDYEAINGQASQGLDWVSEVSAEVEAAVRALRDLQYRMDLVASPPVLEISTSLHAALRQFRRRLDEVSNKQSDKPQPYSQTEEQRLVYDAYIRENIGRIFLNLRNQVRTEQGLAETTLGLSLERLDFTLVDLAGAKLLDAELPEARFFRADLQAVNLAGANLSRADLREADLTGADLTEAALSGANFFMARLTEANLTEANLQEANLQGANLQGASLRDANLEEAILYEAYLQGADLTDANLEGANLREAEVSDKQVADTRSLQGATMPNGQKYEDWLKRRGRELQGEDSGPS
jgi:uncharacterized protein YjbI with pentapeptide repeats